jgi:uncharacterized protein YacL
MVIWILRAVFLFALIGVAFSVINQPVPGTEAFKYPWWVFVAICFVGSVVLAFDILTPRKRIDVISCVYFGILIGLFLTWVFSQTLGPLMTQFRIMAYKPAIESVLGVIFCYFCVSMLLQTRDDFRFIIPYVEFSKEVKGVKPYILDTSVVIDGLAKHLGGKVITGDYNLNKLTKIHGVPVINLNDIANALKPVFLPGEQLEVRVVKPGEEFGQGVGYLDDGTMIVIEGGRDHINQTVRIAVTSVLQTSAGRMIFGKYQGGLAS